MYILFNKDHTLKKKLKRSKKKQVKIEDDMEAPLREEPQQNDEEERSEEGQQPSGQKEKASSALIPLKKEKSKLRRKKKVNDDKPIQDVPQSPEENKELSTTGNWMQWELNNIVVITMHTLLKRNQN